jgi:outer membrane protein
MRNKKSFRTFMIFFLIFASQHIFGTERSIHLTLDSAVKIAMNNSYRMKQLEMGIQRTMLHLKSRRAGLKSRAYMNIKSPEINRISDYKWNSTLYKDEIVRQNTRIWQSDLSIRQPVILFGYPTNGYVSLNYKVYRYLQKDNGDTDVNYYNRLYAKFEQPFFLPNVLKNDLERAELNLQVSKLEYVKDRVELIDDISDQYFRIFERAFNIKMFETQLEILQRIKNELEKIVKNDPGRKIEKYQIELEIANNRENLLENKSDRRRFLANLKQRLRLNSSDSLIVTPDVKLFPITISLNQALNYGLKHNPRLQQMKIRKRESELDVDNVKGWNAFHMNLEVTYGLEKQDEWFADIWEQYDNSNSVTLNAYIPIWDWGQRKARIQAEHIDVSRRELWMEEIGENIKKNITNAYTNLKEYQQRAINMKKSQAVAGEITELSIDKYKSNEVSLQDLLQIIERRESTEQKFLDTYLGFRKALLSLMINTYYDYENNVSLMDKFSMFDPPATQIVD